MKSKTKSAVIIAVLLVVFLALGTLVKMPVAAMGPGPTFNTLGDIRVPSNPRKGDGSTNSTSATAGKGQLVPVIDITGVPLDPVDGHLNMTTVNVLSGMNFFEMVRIGLHKEWNLVPLSAIYPPGVSQEQVQQEQAAEMTLHCTTCICRWPPMWGEW